MFFISHEIAIGDIINIGAMFIALIGIFLTYGTLVEMKKQRIAASLPILVLKTQMEYTFKISDLINGIMPEEDFRLNIENIGNGVARNINVFFSFSDEIIEECQYINIDRKHINVIFSNNEISINNSYFYDKNCPHKYQSLPSLQSQPLFFGAKMKLIMDVLSVEYLTGMTAMLKKKLFNINFEYEDIYGYKYRSCYRIESCVGYGNNTCTLIMENVCIMENKKIK